MKQGKRHALLVFHRRYRNRRGLYFFVALLVFGLYVLVRLLPLEISDRFPWTGKFDWVLLLIGAIIFIIGLFRWIASEIPYVQCTEQHLKIQAPLYPIVISYKRMKTTRPNPLFQVFHHDQLSRAERSLVLDDKAGGQTAVVIDMASWPMRLTYLKFWLSKLMITSDNRGLILWVEDWMTLNRELGDFKDRWRDRKTGRDGGPSARLYNRITGDE